MEAADRPKITSAGWQQYRARIERLLVQDGRTLADTMKLLSEDPDFPYATLAMWKKQITRWKLDVKNHKYSTIVAAAAHYQQCQREGRPFRFDTLGCKPVTEEELFRYARRRGLLLVDGKLLPRGLPQARAVTSAIQANNPHNSNEDSEEQCTNVDSQRGREANATTLLSTKRRLKHLRQLQRQRQLQICLKLLNSECSVRPSDLKVSESVASHENLLRALDVCLKLNVGDWSLTTDGRYEFDNSALEVRVVAFEDMFKAVGLLAKRHDKIWQARKVLHNGLTIFRVALTVCMPLAIKTFWEFVYEYIGIEPGLVHYILTYCASRKGVMADIDSTLVVLFESLKSLDYDNLSIITSQGFQVCGAVFEALIPGSGLNWHSAYSRSIAIAANMFQDYKVRLKLLKDLLLEAELCEPFMSPQILCLKTIAYLQFTVGEFVESNNTIDRALATLERLQYSESCEYASFRIQLLSQRSENLWYAGAVSEAICILKDLIKYAIENDEEYVQLLTRLYWMQQQCERPDSDYGAQFQDLVDKWVNLSIDEKDPVLGALDSEECASVLKSKKLTPLQSTIEDLTPYEDAAAQESTKFVDNHASKEEIKEAWRPVVTQSEQESIFLPVVIKE